MSSSEEARSAPRVVRSAAMDWVKFDSDLARDGSVDPVDKALYAALASFVDRDDRNTDPDPDGDDVPTRRVLAECIGRSPDTVDRSTKRLEAIGLIRVKRRRDPDNPKSNLPSVYELRDHEWWDERAAQRAEARRNAREQGQGGGGRTGAARGGRTGAARGGRTGAAVPSSSKKIPPPPRAPESQAPQDGVLQEEEERGSANEKNGSAEGPPVVSAEALALVDSATAQWVGHRLPTDSERATLAQRAAEATAGGAAPEGIVYALTRDLSLSQVRTTAVQVVMSRTAQPRWANARVPAPRQAPEPKNATGCATHPQGPIDPTPADPKWGQCLLCNTRRHQAAKQERQTA